MALAAQSLRRNLPESRGTSGRRHGGDRARRRPARDVEARAKVQQALARGRRLLQDVDPQETLEQRVALAMDLCEVLAELHSHGAAGARLWQDLQPAAHGPAALTAPEVRKGAPFRPSADVFAAGRLLHYLLSGRCALDEPRPVPHLEDLSDCQTGLRRIVRKCTCVLPKHRYQTVQDLLDDLWIYDDHSFVGLRRSSANEADEPGRRSAATLPRRQRASGIQLAHKALPEWLETTPSFDLEPIDPPQASRISPTTVQPAAESTDIVQLPPAAEGRPRPPKCTRIRPLIFIAGIALTVASLAWSVTVGSASTLLTTTALSLVGAALMGFASPSGSTQRLLARAAIAMVPAVALLTINPVGWAFETVNQRRLISGDPAEAALGVRNLIDGGTREFSGALLDGADFTDMPLDGAVLRGAHLRGAVLQGTDLSNAVLAESDLSRAVLAGANLAGASLDGAMLAGVDLTNAVGLSEAHCNVRTVLPDGYSCVLDRIVVNTNN